MLIGKSSTNLLFCGGLLFCDHWLNHIAIQQKHRMIMPFKKFSDFTDL